MARLRKAYVPYNQQPPSGLPPLCKGIGQNLVYASAIPYEAVWTRNAGWVIPTVVNGTAPTYSAKYGLGKTVVINHTSNTPLGVGQGGIVDPPLSIMICFRMATVGTYQMLLSHAGESTAGWMLGNQGGTNLLDLWVNSSSNEFTDITLAADIPYCAVITWTASSGTLSAYIRNLDTGLITIAAPLTTGAYTTTTQPLTIGAGWATTYQDAWDGDIGSFAVWDRVLQPAEAISLLGNPYQIWQMPSSQHGVLGADEQYALTGTSSTSAVGLITASQVLTTTASTLGIGSVTQAVTLGLSGNQSTSSVGNVTAVIEGDVAIDLTTSSIAFTGSVGSVVLSHGPRDGLLGNQITTAVGTIPAPASQHGVRTITAVGSLGVQVTLNNILTGVVATTQQGFVLNLEPTQALSGTQVATDVGTLVLAVTPAITGVIIDPQLGILDLGFTTVVIADNLIIGDVGSVILLEPEAAITGNQSTGSVGTLGVNINTDQDFGLSSVYLLGQVGTLVGTGGLPYTPVGGGITSAEGAKKIPKRKAPKPDYALMWTLKVVGNEEEYLGPKIREYYPSIPEDVLSNTINNIVTMMQTFFNANPNLQLWQLVINRENEVIKFWSLIALKNYNASVQVDEKPYRAGLLG
jgi:hypothetical protein